MSDHEEKIDLLLKCSKDLPVHQLDDYGKDYIDYLGFSRNPIEYNIVQGVDQYKRPFFAFKIIIQKKDKNVDFLMDTLFQRYTGGYCWMICGHYSKTTMWTAGGIKSSELQFYIDLITKGHARITKDIRYEKYNHLGCMAIIGSKEEWEAAKLIQKVWRKRDAMDDRTDFTMESLKNIFPKWDEKDFKNVFPKIVFI